MGREYYDIQDNCKSAYTWLYSNILLNIDRTDIGVYLSLSCLEPFLKTGVTFATLSLLGNVPL